MKTERQPAGDRVPSESECRALAEEHGMLHNIKAHSEAVMRVATSIVDDLVAPDGMERPLVVAAALLHDITKTRALGTRERHDKSGGELVRGLGMERVARIIEQHVYLESFAPDGPLLESEIVYYADKRVMHDTVVSLDERLEDLVVRYGGTPEREALIRGNFELARAVEAKIARRMRSGARGLQALCGLADE